MAGVTPGAAGQWVLIAAFCLKKKNPIPEKQDAIRHETIEVTLASVSVREDS